MPSSVVTFFPNPSSITVINNSTTITTVAAGFFAHVSSSVSSTNVNGQLDTVIWLRSGAGTESSNSLTGWVPTGTAVRNGTATADSSYTVQNFAI